jgi:hypothetical protein
MGRVQKPLRVTYHCPYSPEEQEKNREEFFRVIAKWIYDMMKKDGVFSQKQQYKVAP